MLFVPSCPACGRAGRAPCPTCRGALVPLGEVAPPPGVDACLALFSYEGAGRALVTGLKYRNHRDAVAWLAHALAVQSTGVPDFVAPGTVVTWVPASAARRRSRGFDQAALLARRTAGRLHRPSGRLLRRGAGPAQTGRSRGERLAGPVLVASAPIGGPVLLVDDVLTTGATIRAAASALRAAGAPSVVAAVVARTPDPRSSGGP